MTTASASVLRDRLLAAARAARPGGQPTPVPPPISSLAAFARAAEAFGEVLAILSAEQWRTPVLRDLDVQGLVGHLSGVERDVQRALAGDAEVADADHVASTQDLVVAQRDRRVSATRAEWLAAVERTSELVAERPPSDGAVLSMHGMRLPLDALLVVRAFELWTHENDIRRAVGLPPSVPDPSLLMLMTSLAVRLLPHAAARRPSSTALHLVLTGAGGGTWDVALGARAGAAAASDVTIVVDAVDFCRVVANRVAPEALDVHVEGDAAGAREVFAAAASLALD